MQHGKRAVAHADINLDITINISINQGDLMARNVDDITHLQAFHFHGAIGVNGFVTYDVYGNLVNLVPIIIYIISQVYLYYSSALIPSSSPSSCSILSQDVFL